MFYSLPMMFKFVNFRCPIELYERIKAIADEQERSVSWVIIDALKKQVGLK